jgi:2-amino-4-hydroxy-6-hydroxymethyldihydropteridine diphosphokinase
VTQSVVGLGSSIGSRHVVLQTAVSAIGAHRHSKVLRVSRVYESPPMGLFARGAFLNGAILIDWSGTPIELMGFLQSIEKRFGRQKSVRWGDRVLDADILWMDGVEVRQSDLVIPHPGLRERNFALWPLLDVLPDAVERYGVTTTQHLGKMKAPTAIGVLAA